MIKKEVLILNRIKTDDSIILSVTRMIINSSIVLNQDEDGRFYYFIALKHNRDEGFHYSYPGGRWTILLFLTRMKM
jgi:hypothetical protein